MDIENCEIDKEIGSGAYGKVYTIKNNDKFVLKENINSYFLDSIKECDISRKVLSSFLCTTVCDISYSLIEKNNKIYSKNSLLINRGTYDADHYLSENRDAEEIKLFLLYLALGIEFLHSRGIVHQDLKPGNIIVKLNENKELINPMITDFGLSCMYNFMKPISKNLVTSPWRAPEIFINGHIYDFKIDVWAYAMIFCGALKGTPILFDNIDTDEHIFEQMMDIFGCDLYPKKRVRNLKHLKIKDKVALDLIDKMTKVDPCNRCNITEVVNHNFFKEHRELINEIRVSTGINNCGKWITNTPKLKVKNSPYRDDLISLLRKDFLENRLHKLITLKTLDLINKVSTVISKKFTGNETKRLYKVLRAIIANYYDFVEYDKDLDKEDYLLALDILQALDYEIVDYSIAETRNNFYPFDNHEVLRIIDTVKNLEEGNHVLFDINSEILL